MNQYCPKCGALIRAGQERCLNCGEYLWERETMQNKWISVKQELPKMKTDIIEDDEENVEFHVSDPVIGYTAENEIVIVRAEQCGCETIWIDEPGTLYIVTHWMPLPQEPKGVT